MKSQPEDSDRSSKSNCWSSFKRHLRNSERRCERENEEGAVRPKPRNKAQTETQAIPKKNSKHM